MIKYICDKCKLEVKNLTAINLPVIPKVTNVAKNKKDIPSLSRSYNKVTLNKYELCDTCLTKIAVIFNAFKDTNVEIKLDCDGITSFIIEGNI